MLVEKVTTRLARRRNLIAGGLRRFGCTSNGNGDRESRRARFYVGKAETQGHSNSRLHGVHVFQCTDQLGIVASISRCIASRGANILNVDLYIDFDGGKPVFYSRSGLTPVASEFAFDPVQWPRAVMDDDFSQLSRLFNADKSIVQIPSKDPDLKMAVLASWQVSSREQKQVNTEEPFAWMNATVVSLVEGIETCELYLQDHCLVDLLYRWQEGELPVDIGCVISNHDRGPNTHVVRFLERHGIPYHYLPTSKGNKREPEILNLVSGTDFLVLARYMQVLSPEFLRHYKKDIINIHHGLLPSFKGANPYRQAYEAGVKLIGATSHFVTEELDDGPIIEQMVDRISHRDSLHSFATRSENLEKQCLAKAIKYYCELRILRYSNNKTIVFS